MSRAAGIHGLIASGVAERTRELGIRLALGATVSQAIRTAALPGIVLTLIGLGVGTALALGSVGRFAACCGASRKPIR